jgi:hypothetical protein
MTLYCQEFELFDTGLTKFFAGWYGETQAGLPLIKISPVAIEMNGRHDQIPPGSSGSGKETRIETQIHRRRKARAFSPLEQEWDISQPAPPGQLRMTPVPRHPPGSSDPVQENVSPPVSRPANRSPE